VLPHSAPALRYGCRGDHRGWRAALDVAPPAELNNCTQHHRHQPPSDQSRFGSGGSGSA